MLLLVGIAAIALIFGWLWLKTLVGLLRRGPGDHPAWWAGCLAVVALLGPIGAVAYLLADPHVAHEHHPDYRRDR